MNQALVDEILKRVLEVLESKQAQENVTLEEKREKILVIAQEQTNFQTSLKDSQTSKSYHVEYAADFNYDVALQEYQYVFLGNLSNVVLGKLSNGIFDSPFLNLISQAILTGKKIYVPSEEVEIYDYQNSAPKLYYKMMTDKVEFLKNSGILFTDSQILLNNFKTQKVNTSITVQEKLPEVKPVISGETVIIKKKVIIEKDIRQAAESGAFIVCIPQKSILSDLAKEYAKDKKIEVKREDHAHENTRINL